MSLHIAAKAGDVAETILLPGDPLRAKFVAENLLTDAFCYNEVRGMYGFTGTYQGKRVSVQGTGMGVPSISIYAHELISEYGVKNLIRVGPCGSLQAEVQLRDVLLAMSASTDSQINKLRFGGMDFAPTADFSLLKRAYDVVEQQGIKVKVGNVLTSDTFYHDNPQHWKLWADFGVLAIEMETAALYTLAAKFGVRALAILTVSDSLVTHQKESAQVREQALIQMIKIALDINV